MGGRQKPGRFRACVSDSDSGRTGDGKSSLPFCGSRRRLEQSGWEASHAGLLCVQARAPGVGGTDEGAGAGAGGTQLTPDSLSVPETQASCSLSLSFLISKVRKPEPPREAAVGLATQLREETSTCRGGRQRLGERGGASSTRLAGRRTGGVESGPRRSWPR